MPPSCEANGRTRLDCCTGPRAHTRRVSGASSRVLPRRSELMDIPYAGSTTGRPQTEGVSVNFFEPCLFRLSGEHKPLDCVQLRLVSLPRAFSS